MTAMTVMTVEEERNFAAFVATLDREEKLALSWTMDLIVNAKSKGWKTRRAREFHDFIASRRKQ